MHAALTVCWLMPSWAAACFCVRPCTMTRRAAARALLSRMLVSLARDSKTCGGIVGRLTISSNAARKLGFHLSRFRPPCRAMGSRQMGMAHHPDRRIPCRSQGNARMVCSRLRRSLFSLSDDAPNMQGDRRNKTGRQGGRLNGGDDESAHDQTPTKARALAPWATIATLFACLLAPAQSPQRSHVELNPPSDDAGQITSFLSTAAR